MRCKRKVVSSGISVIEVETGGQTQAEAVALADGGFFATWHSNTAAQARIAGRTFSDTAVPQTGNILLNDAAAGPKGTSGKGIVQSVFSANGFE